MLLRIETKSANPFRKADAFNPVDCALEYDVGMQGEKRGVVAANRLDVRFNDTDYFVSHPSSLVEGSTLPSNAAESKARWTE